MKPNRAWIWSGVAVLAVAVAVGVLLPSFIKARQTSCRRACINNLRIIDAAKEQAVYNKELPPDADFDDPASRVVGNLRLNTSPSNPQSLHPSLPAGGDGIS